MNLDSYGLPVQSDGDALDQLNRVGLLAMSDQAWRRYKLIKLECPWSYGSYVRHVGGSPNNVSGDQLVPVFAACMLGLSKSPFYDLCIQLAKRLGFAQNTHDTNGSRKLVPDFLLHRVVMFVSRVYFNISLVHILDIFLFVNTLVTVIDLRMRNDPDHVDPFVNACATLYACNVYRPTYLSKLSARMLGAGSVETFRTGLGTNNVANGLLWYHRAASGGNPEIGILQVQHWVETLKIARS